MTMPAYEFVGPDPIDHFHLGRVTPGDVVDLDDDPSGPWKVTKKRPGRAQSAEQTPAGTEHGSDDPDPAEEG
jgi:hypothetical protein